MFLKIYLKFWVVNTKPIKTPLVADFIISRSYCQSKIMQCFELSDLIRHQRGN